jgi:hypothetical protein
MIPEDSASAPPTFESGTDGTKPAAADQRPIKPRTNTVRTGRASPGYAAQAAGHDAAEVHHKRSSPPQTRSPLYPGQQSVNHRRGDASTRIVSETGTPRATEVIGENEGRMSSKMPWQAAEARTPPLWGWCVDDLNRAPSEPMRQCVMKLHEKLEHIRLVTNPNFAGEH